MNRLEQLEASLDKLGKEFDLLDLTFHKMLDGKKDDVTSYWPGPAEDDILICVFKGNLPTLYTDSDLFRFFIEPQKKRFSDEFIHLNFSADYSARTILSLTTYANTSKIFLNLNFVY